MIQRSFVSLAEAMPEDRYAFKPIDGAFKDVRTFAEQVKHVACANMGFFDEIERKTPPANCGAGGPDPARTKAELLTYLKDSFSYGDRVIRETTPSNALDPVDGPYGGEHTARDRDAGRLARVGSLRPARRLRADEQHRAAGERAVDPGCLFSRHDDSCPESLECAHVGSPCRPALLVLVDNEPFGPPLDHQIDISLAEPSVRHRSTPVHRAKQPTLAVVAQAGGIEVGVTYLLGEMMGGEFVTLAALLVETEPPALALRVVARNV